MANVNDKAQNRGIPHGFGKGTLKQGERVSYTYCREHGRYEGSYCQKCDNKKSNSSPAIKVFKPYYHIGIGEQVNSTEHKKQLYKKHGVVEVGTDQGVRKPQYRGLTGKQAQEAMKEERNARY